MSTSEADVPVSAHRCGNCSLPREHTDLSFTGHLCLELCTCTALRCSSRQHVKPPWCSSSLSILGQSQPPAPKHSGEVRWHMAAIHTSASLALRE